MIRLLLLLHYLVKQVLLQVFFSFFGLQYDIQLKSAVKALAFIILPGHFQQAAEEESNTSSFY